MRVHTMRTVLTGLALAACAGDDAETSIDETGDVSADGCPSFAPGEDGNCFLSGTYTEDITLTPDLNWILRGGVFIGDDETEVTLTIEPGTTLYGESATDGMLVVRRMAQIQAVGTADAPIVMTSSKAVGSRARGDWGGLIINGRAPINACSDEAETCEAYGEGGTGWYGGSDPDDSSGALSYVRVEFAGTLVSPDNELNGIAFQGVGRNTQIDHIQVHQNADDGVEFFGGTAEVSHVVITGAGDDSLDWTDGWQGKAQFVVLQQGDDASDNGIEADNNGENNGVTPMSQPILSNLTIIGSPDSANSDIGILLREGTGAFLYSALVVGFNDACLDVDNTATWSNVDSGDLTIESSHLACGTLYKDDDDDGGLAAWYEGQPGNTTGSDLDVVVSPFDLVAPNFASAGAATSGGATPDDAFFESVSFKGAVEASNDWTAGWTNYAAN